MNLLKIFAFDLHEFNECDSFVLRRLAVCFGPAERMFYRMAKGDAGDCRAETVTSIPWRGDRQRQSSYRNPTAYSNYSDQCEQHSGQGCERFDEIKLDVVVVGMESNLTTTSYHHSIHSIYSRLSFPFDFLEFKYDL